MQARFPSAYKLTFPPANPFGLSPTLAYILFAVSALPNICCSFSTMSAASNPDDALPTTEQLSAARAAYVLDGQNNRLDFATLLDRARTDRLPLVLIFTRHFHCGMCKEYVKALARSTILTDASKVSLVIVGPGQAAGLEHYKDQVDRPPFAFYADPELELYHALGVTKRSLDLGDASKDKIGSHHQQSFARNLLGSVTEIVKSGSLALKGGDFKQLGGEFVWDQDGKPVLAHRMKHTRDHTEVSVIEQAATATS